MKKTFYICILLLLGATSTILEAASPVIKVKLKLTLSKIMSTSSLTLKLNKDGVVEFPFMNKSGKLFVKLKNNRCYVDSDGDGKFDESPEKAIRSYSPFSVPVIHNGVEYLYGMKIFILSKDTLMLMGFSAYIGEYKGSKITLYDINMNGDFSEVGVDAIKLGVNGKQTVIKAIHLLSRKMLLTKIKNGGGDIAFTEYNGPIAKVRAVTSAGRYVDLFIANKERTISLPVNIWMDKTTLPGEYDILRVMSVSIPAKGKKQALNVMQGAGGSLVLKTGNNVIKLAGPYTLQFKAIKTKKHPDIIKIESISLKGSCGVIYDGNILSPKPKSNPILCLIRSGDKEKELIKMKYG